MSLLKGGNHHSIAVSKKCFFKYQCKYINKLLNFKDHKEKSSRETSSLRDLCDLHIHFLTQYVSIMKSKHTARYKKIYKKRK